MASLKVERNPGIPSEAKFVSGPIFMPTVTMDDGMKTLLLRAQQCTVVYTDYTLNQTGAKLVHEDAAMAKWMGQYMDGTLPQSKLLSIPNDLDTLRAALLNLPESAKTNALHYLDHYQGLASTTTPFILDDDLLTRVGDVTRRVKANVSFRKNNSEDRFTEEQLAGLADFTVALQGFDSRFSTVFPIEYYWQRELEWGRLSLRSLANIPSHLNFLRQYELEFLDSQGLSKDVRDHLETPLEKYYTERFNPDLITALASTLAHGIYPTSLIRKHLEEYGEKGWQEIIDLKNEINSGKLDPQNQLQVSLLYTDYLKVRDNKDHDVWWYGRLYEESLLRLKFSEEIDTEPLPMFTELNEQERKEAAVAAFESALLYWFVKERVDLGRKVALIGNDRYQRFCIEPISYDLEQLGVKLRRQYVHSVGGNDLDNGLADFLESAKPDDVIVVDGTPRPLENNGIPRFPNSINTYKEWFEKYQMSKDLKPEIAHWLPYQADGVVIGSSEYHFLPPSSNGFVVTFANPVVAPERFPNFPAELKNHQPGFFDDPNKFTYVSESEIYLTPDGVKEVWFDGQGNKHSQKTHSFRQDEGLFTLMVQEEIARNFPLMLLRTSPNT